MANVIEVLNDLEGQPTPNFSVTAPVKAGAVGSILPGYLVIVDGGNAGYVKAAADACASTSLVVGVASSTSTDTVAADGTVTFVTAPVLFIRIHAKTPANLTAAMVWTDKYILDVSSGAYTLDQGTTTNGIFTIVKYPDTNFTTTGVCLATVACNKFLAI